MAHPKPEQTKLQPGTTISVEPVGDIDPGFTEPNPIEDRRVPPDEVGNVRRELDDTRIRLLAALDAVVGAEAETSAAQARIRELELEHHMLVVERDELRREVERQAGRRRSGLRRTVRLFRSAARRIIT